MRLKPYFSKFGTRLSVLGISIMLATGCAGPSSPYSYNDIPEPSLTAELPKSFAGSYLAGRFAQHNRDWDTAFTFMSEAMALDDTQSDTGLLDRTFLLALSNGRIDEAGTLADKIIERGTQSDLARIFRISTTFAEQDYAGANTHIGALSDRLNADYTLPLLQAWIHMGEGKTEDALASLKTADFAADPLYQLHTAVIKDFTGASFKDIRKDLDPALSAGLTLHETTVAANIYARHGDKDQAMHIYKAIAAQDPHSPIAAYGIEQIKSKAKPVQSINTVEDGFIFALFSMATILYERQAYDSALIYGRMIEHVDQNDPMVNVMIGDILSFSQKYDEAIGHYQRVNSKDPLFEMAQFRTVEVLETAGRTAEALDVLAVMSEDDSLERKALTYMGDIYHKRQDFNNALAAYDRAIETLDQDSEERYWSLIFARGISHERMDNWQKAELDMLHALSLQPRNPHILNTIGYIWLEKGVKIDDAFNMIRKAVILAPDNGFILDSYGWAFFKKRNFKDSVYWLEQAIAIEPLDSSINDHLGDAYWYVGRKKEARFQWQRAMKYTQDKGDILRIKQKLQFGLPALPPQTPATAVEREAALTAPTFDR